MRYISLSAIEIYVFTQSTMSMIFPIKMEINWRDELYIHSWQCFSVIFSYEIYYAFSRGTCVCRAYACGSFLLIYWLNNRKICIITVNMTRNSSHLMTLKNQVRLNKLLDRCQCWNCHSSELDLFNGTDKFGKVIATL